MASGAGGRNQGTQLVTDDRGIEHSSGFNHGVQVFGVIFDRESCIDRGGLRTRKAARIVNQTAILALEHRNGRPPALARHRPSTDEDKRWTVAVDLKVERTLACVQKHRKL